jgi:hypothetical protein
MIAYAQYFESRFPYVLCNLHNYMIQLVCHFVLLLHIWCRSWWWMLREFKFFGTLLTWILLYY